MSLRKTLEYRKLHFTAVTTRKYECEEQTFRVMCRVSRIQTTASLSDDNNSSLYCGLSPKNHVHNNQLVVQTTLDKSNHQGKLNHREFELSRTNDWKYSVHFIRFNCKEVQWKLTFLNYFINQNTNGGIAEGIKPFHILRRLNLKFN